jgi:hypothetical protein
MVTAVDNYTNAGAKAKELDLEASSQPGSRGWQPAKGAPDLSRYAEQQGPSGGPTVADLFRNGKVDPSMDKYKAGEWSQGKDSPQEVFQERGKALAELRGAIEAHAAMPDAVDAKNKAVLAAEIDERAVIDEKDKAGTETRKNELNRHKESITTHIEAFSGLLGVAKNVAKRDVAELASADPLVAIANLHFLPKLQELEAKIDGFTLKISDGKVKAALAKKEQAMSEARAFTKGEVAKAKADMLAKFEAYKTATDKLARAMRTAAEARAKKEHKSEAEQKKAGGEAEALVRGMSIVEHVLATARSGAATCTPPGYTRESGAGFGAVGDGPAVDMMLHVGEIKGYQRAFNQVAERWTERREQLNAILKTHNAGPV